MRPSDKDLDDELRDFLERSIEDKLRGGLTREQATRAARMQLGSVAAVKDRVRDVGWQSLADAFRQDLRYAVRTLARAPLFTAIAAGSSALGIGACAVIFAVLDAAVLKPLAVDAPSRLVSLSEIDRRTAVAGGELSYPDLRDLRNGRPFDGVAAADYSLTASIASGSDPERLWGALVTANYFAVVRPGFAAGHGFDAARDDTPGESPVVVLSYDLWQRRFGGDTAIVGKSIAINTRPATVVGVTARDFRGTEAAIAPAFWIPFSMIDEHRVLTGIVSRVLENRQRHWLSVVARLREGVDLAAARAEVEVTARTLNLAHGIDDTRGFYLERAGQVDPEYRRTVLGLFSLSLGVAVLILLTACVNVASLLLGRASARQREIAARMALGASRGRIVRQLLTESLVLAAIGGAGGWAIASYVCSLFGVLRTPFGWPLDLTVTLDYRVLLFCAGLSIGTGVAFGLVPAVRATQTDRLERLRLRNGLVVAQLAICTVLLISMGLFTRSLRATRHVDIGLNSRNLLLMAFDPGLDRRSPSQAKQLLREIVDRARQVRGVEAATLTSGVPLTTIVSNSNFVPAEDTKNPQAKRIRSDIYAVGPEFFSTMGISLVAGEDFSRDRQAAPRPAIVNDAFARAAFAGGSAIGRRIAGDGKALDIIGVVATAKSRGVVEAPRPIIYLPILNEYSAADAPRGVTLVVRTRGPAATYATAMRDAVRQVDRSLAVFDVRTMDTHVNDSMLVPRLASVLSVVAGSVGLLIAIVGVYGVVSFAVARRRREIGIRLAIGASPREILALVMGQGLRLGALGIAIGVTVASATTRLTVGLLYGVTPTDAATFAIVPPLVGAVALAAAALPARAAARVDPAEVLRTE